MASSSAVNGVKSEHEEISDSDASFLSDIEEVDHMKITNGVDQLQFVDSYFQRDTSTILADPADLYNSDDSSLNTSLLPWDRLADWIHCFCVVTFDLEIGQMIEVFIQFRCQPMAMCLIL